VTALVAERRGRVRIDLDGERWRSLPVAAVVGARLAVGTELDRTRARTLRRELRRAEALAVGTAALARRDRSAAGLAALLERRRIPASERTRTVETLERAGYLDDGRFAASRAAALAGRGFGDEAIRFDLERAGVEPDEITLALAALDAEADRATAIVERSGRTSRSARRLAAKGFSQESVEAAIGER
jgi:SOS response regulatory protein OraA/RecX